MLLHAFIPASRANGPGLRAVIYFQGCSLQCPGCWNPRSHRFTGTDVHAADLLRQIESAMSRSPLEGVTFSGGEPMQQVQAVLELMSGIRAAAPSLSIGMFTGYTEAELDGGDYATRLKTQALDRRELWRIARGYLDFAIMGRYDRTHAGVAPLRTSANQRLKLFSRRYREEEFAEQLVEVGIDQTGTAVLTGFPILGPPTL